MRIKINAIWLPIALSVLVLSLVHCQKSSDSSTSARSGDSSGAGGSASLAKHVNVTGTIALDPAAQDIPQTAAQTANRDVQLVSDSGLVLATAKTTPAGAFTVALDTTSAGLLDGASDTNSSAPMVVTLKSLFLANGSTQPTALGVTRTLALDGLEATAMPDGSMAIDTGAHKVGNVGAIVGKIKFETGSDPTGIDVYVPGTTNIAKTDGSGQFLLGFLAPGSYSIRADKDGFGSVVWDSVEVKLQQTTALADAIMRIATGPKIAEFSLDTAGTVALSATINLKLKLPGATKFRVSQLADFRDATYRPVDVTQDEMTIPFSVSGPDGPVTINLEAADSDGLTANQSLAIILDTVAPIVPTFTLASPQAQAGYTNSTTPILHVGACGSADSLLLTEDARFVPDATAFVTKCADASATAGTPVSISTGDGTKTVYLWALDAGGRVSTTGSSATVVLDTVAPVLTVNPPSGPYNDTVPVVASAGDNVTIYYTTNLAAPTTASSTITGTLLVPSDSTVKFLAVDFAGNQSAVVQRVYTIDRSPPILGSVTAQTTGGFVKSTTVALTVSAQNADFMAFAETADGLATPTWQTNSGSANYTLQSTADGKKTIYAEFKDVAGNILGGQGQISTTFILDTTAPATNSLTLLAPETPSGDFDKRLAWTSSYTEPVTFEVEVSTNADFAANSGHIVAPVGSGKLETTATSITVQPTLTAEGLYYWRVRARDAAGNESAWVSSDPDKNFTLRILARAFQSRRNRDGTVTATNYYNSFYSDRFYGWDVALLSDLNGSGGLNLQPEIAVSIAQTAWDPSSQCPGCAAVKVIDVENNRDLAMVYDPNATQVGGNAAPAATMGSLFGQRVIGCNITGNGAGRDQLIVTAPGQTYRDQTTFATYNNQGAVYAYAYSAGALTLVGEQVRNASDTCTPYWPNGGSCASGGWYGNNSWVQPLPDPPLGTSYGGPYLGWSVACERRPGSHDYLLVSEPGTTTNGAIGRVIEMQLTGGAIVPTGVEWDAPAGIGDAGFGIAVTYLKNFQDYACNGGNAGEVIVIGAPRQNETGSVYVYGKTNGAWDTTYCNRIDAQSTDPVGIGFGATLADVGSPDTGAAAIGATDKLAVGAPGLTCSSQGGLVRIYGNGSQAALKSVSNVPSGGAFYGAPAWGSCGGAMGQSDSFHRFGYSIAAAGDFDTTPDSITEIAVSAPEATVNNISGAGAVYIYKWANLATGDSGLISGNPPSPIKTITGLPGYNDRFGARYIAVPSVGSSVDAVPNYVLISRPDHAIQQAAQNIGGAAAAAMPANSIYDVGEVQEFSTVNLKIGTPFALTGTETNEAFGRSLVALPDINGDQTPDLFVTRPVGRCNGLTWGAASIISGHDSVAFKDICGTAYDADVGHEALFLPPTGSGTSSTGALMVSEKVSGNLHFTVFLNADASLLNESFNSGGSSFNPTPSPKEGDVSLSDVKQTSGSVDDYLVIGDSKYANTGVSGSAELVEFNGTTVTDSGCSVTGSGSGTLLGKGVGLAIAHNATKPHLLVGAPGMAKGVTVMGDVATGSPTINNVTSTAGIAIGYSVTGSGIPAGTVVSAVNSANVVTLSQSGTNSFAQTSLIFADSSANSTGAVFIIDALFCTANTTLGGSTPVSSQVLRINADDAKIKTASGSSGAAAGFGSYVLGLPDLDGTGGHDLFLLIANTNLRLEDSGVTPEYYIIAVDFGTPATYTVLRYESGAPGSMLGGYARILGDVNADGVPDIAISAPVGPGSYGNTGQVRILSGKALVTTNADPLIQVIYNPDPGTSHFGVSMEYADMNGDGFRDIIVGADRYSGAAIQSAGALYVFPVVPVQQ